MIDILQRQSMRIILAGLAVFVAVEVADRFVDLPGWVRAIVLVAVVAVLVGLVLVFVFPGKDHDRDPIVVTSPVRGRWLALNSPATKVPSHGVRAYGQAFAIDLCLEPIDGPQRPAFGTGPGMARPEDFPAFGAPVHAMIDGVVVRVADRQRDHRTRSRIWAVLYMMVEGALREFRGADGVIGNQVVIDGGDGVHALVAHLQQGSATVRVGDRVRAGDVIGACGNSGNSSEPHVHAQLMDRPRPNGARGLPMAFAQVEIGGDVRNGLPENSQHMIG
ncbi:M23 family metallopeptidase [Nocardioides sp. AE5]|uniref:M23 family metallopeptidase n=1 Tax=Nocardioides sp. AE5 TaxID=2962573 RepID=UPI002880DCFE|nr:M23 family metallopeptidase [Nocardioides sp. AE5]MDT0200368.1 M23 family metallopeptidase [Nocardioides sp. AE5]